MTKFAAYDASSIYAVAETAEQAISKARDDARDDEAEFETARISDSLASWIEKNGWNGHTRSFDVRNGEIIDTTNA